MGHEANTGRNQSFVLKYSTDAEAHSRDEVVRIAEILLVKLFSNVA